MMADIRVMTYPFLSGNRVDIDAIPAEWLFHDRYNPHVLRSSPLRALHEKAGALFVRLNGVEWVDRYWSVNDEYLTVRAGAGILDVSPMTHLEFIGQEGAMALQHFFTNDIIHAPEYSIRYGALVDKSGVLFDDCLVYILPEQRYWLILNLFVEEIPHEIIADWNSTAGVLGWRDLGQSWVKIQLQGPRAQEVAKKMYRALQLETLPFFKIVKCPQTGAVIGRCGWSGEDGFEIHVPAAQGIELWETLQKNGAQPYGISAIEYCRLDAGLICQKDYLYGQCYPQEVGLGDYVKASVKPHLYGFEAIENANWNTLVWGLVFDPGSDETWKRPPVDANPFRLPDGREAVLTSLVHSPLRNRFVGFAAFPRDAVTNGDCVYIGSWRARVVDLSELRREKEAMPLANLCGFEPLRPI